MVAGAFRFRIHAVELDPEAAAGLNNLGVALQDLGQLEEAEKTLRRALKLEPEYVEALSNLGAVFYEQGLTLIESNKFNRGKLREAYKTLGRALEIDPNFEPAMRRLKQLEDALGEMVVHVDAAALKLDDEVPVKGGTVRCTIVRDMGDGKWLVQLLSPTLQRAWVVSRDAIVRTKEAAVTYEAPARV